MSVNVYQGRVISILNQYLKYHNYPFKLDRKGICNGLSKTYAKYVLEGREEAFKDILQYISGEFRIQTPQEDDINYFVLEVLLSHLPEEYDKSLNQYNSIQALSIQGQKIQSSFDFALVALDTVWIDIFQTIDLKSDEVMLLNTVKHAAAVSKKNGQYIVYDPNYTSGFKVFTTEKALIKELHYNVFYCETRQFGLQISVIRAPKAQDRTTPFPVPWLLYRRYLISDKAANAYARYGNFRFNTLKETSILGDSLMVRTLLDLGATDVVDALEQAVIFNNSDTLTVLLDHVLLKHLEKNTKEYFSFTYHLLLIALRYGRSQIFHDLIKLDSFNSFYNLILYREDAFSKFLIHAVMGGNQDLVKKLLNDCCLDKEIIRASVLVEDNQKSAIKIAVENGYVGCLRVMMDQLESVEMPLTEQQSFGCLLDAIRHNQPLVVQYLLTKASKERLLEISLSLRAVSRTNYLILEQLKSYGVQFNEKAEAIIAQKAHQTLGILTMLGIALIKFTEFFKEFFSNKAGVYYFGIFAHTSDEDFVYPEPEPLTNVIPELGLKTT